VALDCGIRDGFYPLLYPLEAECLGEMKFGKMAKVLFLAG